MSDPIAKCSTRQHVLALQTSLVSIGGAAAAAAACMLWLAGFPKIHKTENFCEKSLSAERQLSSGEYLLFGCSVDMLLSSKTVFNGIPIKAKPATTTTTITTITTTTTTSYSQCVEMRSRFCFIKSVMST
uniref:Uncharacterized protein n=1 Tax=Glossina brevipalpis TaxID=37001 RepID=A0A1A9WSN5_9MUSC